MYKDVTSDQVTGQKNHWNQIYALLGSQSVKNQNLVAEILRGYRQQNVNIERILEKFQQGLPITKEDITDDISTIHHHQQSRLPEQLPRRDCPPR